MYAPRLHRLVLTTGRLQLRRLSSGRPSGLLRSRLVVQSRVGVSLQGYCQAELFGAQREALVGTVSADGGRACLCFVSGPSLPTKATAMTSVWLALGVSMISEEADGLLWTIRRQKPGREGEARGGEGVVTSLLHLCWHFSRHSGRKGTQGAQVSPVCGVTAVTPPLAKGEPPPRQFHSMFRNSLVP